MPIDTSMYSGVTSFADQFSKDQLQAAQLQAAQQQQQLGTYTLLQAKQDFEDQQTMRQAWRDANGNADQALQLAAQRGVSPKTLQAFQVQQLAVRQKVADLAKTDAETQGNKLNQMIQRGDEATQRLQPLLTAANPTEFMARKPAVLDSLQGLATDDELKQLMGADQQGVKDWATMHQSIKAHNESVTAGAAVTKANAAASEADTAKNKLALETPGIQADALQKQASNAVNTLQAAYDKSGAIGYKQALGQLPAEVAARFKDPAMIAGITNPDDAKKLIAQGGMTAAELATQQHQEQQLAQQGRYQTQELAIRRQEAAATQALAQANLALRQQGLDDKEVQQASAPFMRIATEAQTQSSNINSAIQQLNSKDGSTQFIGMLKALKADVAGNGVRLNNAEFDGIMSSRLGGRYAQTMQRLATGKPLDQGQIDALTNAMYDLKAKVSAKINDASNALQDVANAPNQQVRMGKVNWYTRNKFTGSDSQPQQTAPSSGKGFDAASARQKYNY